MPALPALRARAPCPVGGRARVASAARRSNRLAATTVSGRTVGIDLGTSNSAVAVIEGGRAVVVPGADGCSTMPSAVSYGEGGVVAVGAAARRQAALNVANTFYSVKRLVGRRYADVEGERDAYAFELREGDEGLVELPCPALGRALKPEEVSAEVLRALLQRAEGYVGEEVTSAVVTVPAHFSPAQRAATAAAVRMAGVGRVEVLQEPVAAAMAYGFGRGGEEDLVLVFDLGGGTLDVSILEIFDGIIEVVATAGDGRLGGDDFDSRVAGWLAERAGLGAGALGGDPVARQQLAELAERVKCELSSADSARALAPVVGRTGAAVDEVLTRAALEVMAGDLIGRLAAPLAAAGEAAMLSWAELPGGGAAPAAAPAGPYAPRPRAVSQLLLVGGATAMPAARRVVERAAGLAARGDLDASESVALGAAVYAGLLEGELEGGLEVMDGAYVKERQGRVTGIER